MKLAAFVLGVLALAPTAGAQQSMGLGKHDASAPILVSADTFLADINAKTETLHTAFHKVSEAMYQRAQEQAAASSPDGGANGAGADSNGAGAEEDVVDAEVVDEK